MAGYIRAADRASGAVSAVKYSSWPGLALILGESISPKPRTKTSYVAFGKSGKLYVTLAGYSQISVLEADGSESARYSGPATNPDTLATLPWANPANIAFDGHGSLLVTNHASLTGLPDPSPLFAVFDVFVNDKAGKLFGDFDQ